MLAGVPGFEPGNAIVTYVFDMSSELAAISQNLGTRDIFAHEVLNNGHTPDAAIRM